MKLVDAARGALFGAMGAVALSSTFGAGASLAGCGDSPSCAKLRTDTYASKQLWDACNPDDAEPCIKVFGNTKDCTGVLSCDFAVNPHHRADAEQAVLTIPGQSAGCYQCALPNCVSGDIPICEPVSRRCILVSMLTDGGVVASSQPMVRDAGGSFSTPDTGAAFPEASASDAIVPGF